MKDTSLFDAYKFGLIFLVHFLIEIDVFYLNIRFLVNMQNLI